MMDLTKEINRKFNNKYDYLKLLDIVYDINASLCTITFLYPCNNKDITEYEHREIEDYTKELLSIYGRVKVKFKKSFLDEKLIVGAVLDYIVSEKKSLYPYISEKNIHSSSIGENVDVSISLNKDVLKIMDKLELEKGIKDYLNGQFIAKFNVQVSENEETISSKIDFVDIAPPKAKRRYKVNIEENLIGEEKMSSPEYISDVKSSFQSKDSDKTAFECIVFSGLISNLTRKTYKAKKGKHIGEDKTYYTFTLSDSEDSINCVMFCSLSSDKKIEKIDINRQVLCKGDVRTGFSDKITYYVKSIAYASPTIDNDLKDDNIEYNFIEKFTEPPCEKKKEDKQSNLFDEIIEERPVQYTDLINKYKIVVFDIETTGLDYEKCEITEIGAVKIEYGKITERFSSFVKTHEPIPLEVQELTHITNDMIKDAPSIDIVIKSFHEWCQGCVICGHNAIGFDMKFIKKAGEAANLIFDNDVVDTMLIARQSSLKLKNYKLGTIVNALGLTLVDAHRAFNDAYATAQVLLELSKI